MISYSSCSLCVCVCVLYINVLSRKQQILTTMIEIARKYEEICAPQVEEFCYITDNTYFKEEVSSNFT